MKKILVYGYGNPGRQDDGLGVVLSDRMAEWAHKNGQYSMDFESNYQLNIEDALTISEYETVIFADASVEEIQDFKLTKVESNQKVEFTMHAVSPPFVLHLCQTLYNKFPQVFLLHIKGYEFDFLEPMTKKATENLGKAQDFLIDFLSEKDLLFDFREKEESSG